MSDSHILNELEGLYRGFCDTITSVLLLKNCGKIEFVGNGLNKEPANTDGRGRKWMRNDAM